TKNDTACDQNRGGWRHGAGQRTEAKDCRSNKQDPSPAKTIGGFSTDDRANGRSQQNTTDNNFFGCSREAKFAFDKNERAGDNTGVVAKQKATQSGEYRCDVNEPRTAQVCMAECGDRVVGHNCRFYTATRVREVRVWQCRELVLRKMA